VPEWTEPPRDRLGRQPSDNSSEAWPLSMSCRELMQGRVWLQAVSVLLVTLVSCGGVGSSPSLEMDASDGAPITSGSSSSAVGSGQGSGSGQASIDAEPLDAPSLSPGPFRATTDSAPPGCVPTPVGGTGGNGGPGSCTITLGEMCGSASYHVTCACPQGTCACLGATTKVINFGGCPHCPGDPFMVGGSGATTAAEVFALCGFPN
jgi:hypothetical protein